LIYYFRGSNIPAYLCASFAEENMKDKGFSGEATDPRPRDSRIWLDFKKSEAPIVAGKKLIFGENVSALATIGSTLFCASDETVSVERLVRTDDGKEFRDHQSVSLRDFFEFEDESDSEVDLEGLAISDEYLWLAGSHSLKRGEPKAGQAVAKLASMVSWDAKRAFLARIPLVEEKNGIYGLAKKAGSRTCARVNPGKGRDEGLRGLLAQEGVLHSFMNIPSKENGFDIEGLAVSGERVFLGLRGPVIASFALVIELHLKEDEPGVLAPKKIGERAYRLYAVNLGGLGVRDLLFDGGRLLVLSGTSQKAESIQRVFAIDALPETGGVLDKDQVKVLLTLPTSGWGDHAEGIALLDDEGPKRLLVVYDSPSDARLDPDEDRLEADVFTLLN
jgi:hypothetical protein